MPTLLGIDIFTHPAHLPFWGELTRYSSCFTNVPRWSCHVLAWSYSPYQLGEDRPPPQLQLGPLEPCRRAQDFAP